MGLLAPRPRWLGWAGNTLNLGMIRVTCPHSLGPAHNCDDLFLLSKPKGMPPATHLHSASQFSPFFPLCSVSVWVCNYTWYAFLWVCMLVNAPVCLHVSFWPQQPINTACVCLSDAACPRRWHHAPRTLTDRWKRISLAPGKSLLSRGDRPRGRSREGRQRERSYARLS